MCAQHVRLYSLRQRLRRDAHIFLHSRNSAVLFRFHHRLANHQILPTKITKSVHLVCFVFSKKKKHFFYDGNSCVFVCSVRREDHKQRVQSIPIACTATQTLVPRSTSTQHKHTKCSASDIHHTYINTFIPS